MLEAVILAGGEDKKLQPLTALDHPKCLLPVANAPLLQYSLRTLKTAGVTSAIVVVCGETAAAHVKKYIQKEHLVQGMAIQVVTAAPLTGSADAVRLVSDKLIGDCVVVMSGDVITDIPLNTVVFDHGIRKSTLTTVLSKNKVSASKDAKAGRPLSGVTYAALDEKLGQLLSYAYTQQQLRSVMVPLAAVKTCGSMCLTTDYSDASIYVLSRPIVDVIVDNPSLSSIKMDLLPVVVNEQWSNLITRESSKPIDPIQYSPSIDRDEHDLERSAALFLRDLCPTWEPFRESALRPLCGVYIASPTDICMRVNDLPGMFECNHQIASHDTSDLYKACFRDAVHPSVIKGDRITISKACLVEEQTEIGDKASIKRSIVGSCCKIGNGVRIIHSVIMNNCTIADGSYIQNSIIGHNVGVGMKAQLRGCHVGHGSVVLDNANHLDEKLAGRGGMM